MSYKQELIQKIIESTAKTFKTDASKFTAETSLADCNAKSINYVQIIGELEDEYEVEVDFMAFKKSKTIADAAEYVAGLL